jgi:DDE superfamily endonuclease
MRKQGLFDPARLVFIDETSTNTAMVRRRGRAARGERLVDYAPHGAWKTVTFVGALRQNAMTAPFVIEGAMNGPMFPARPPAPGYRVWRWPASSYLFGRWQRRRAGVDR